MKKCLKVLCGLNYSFNDALWLMKGQGSLAKYLARWYIHANIHVSDYPSRSEVAAKRPHT